MSILGYLSMKNEQESKPNAKNFKNNLNKKE